METNGFIQTKRLSRRYATGETQVNALHDVTLSLARGRFVGITGTSGSGKSTLVNLLGGLDTPSSGSLRIADMSVSDLSKHELALFRRHTVGMIFQSFNLIPSYTALENVILPLLFAGVAKAERRQRGLALLGVVGLEARSTHRPGELSGGEQQRVAIARALVNRPQVLLADEPTGNLDSRTSRQLVETLVSLNTDQGLTIVMVSHDQATLRDVSHEIVTLQDGTVMSHEALR